MCDFCRDLCCFDAKSMLLRFTYFCVEKNLSPKSCPWNKKYKYDVYAPTFPFFRDISRLCLFCAMLKIENANMQNMQTSTQTPSGSVTVQQLWPNKCKLQNDKFFHHHFSIHGLIASSARKVDFDLDKWRLTKQRAHSVIRDWTLFRFKRWQNAIAKQTKNLFIFYSFERSCRWPTTDRGTFSLSPM